MQDISGLAGMALSLYKWCISNLKVNIEIFRVNYSPFSENMPYLPHI